MAGRKKEKEKKADGLLTDMQRRAAFLDAHIMSPTEDLAILGDQARSYRNTSLRGAHLGLFQRGEEARILLHRSTDCGWRCEKLVRHVSSKRRVQLGKEQRLEQQTYLLFYSTIVAT